MTAASRPIVVAEDDPFLRIVQLVLDPETPEERVAAFTHFFAHDEPDFPGWCARLRERLPRLAPAQVRLVGSQPELRAALPEARVLVVESLAVGAEELRLGEQLAVVQKYGTVTREIDLAACAARGVQVRTLRRRANISCAEHTLAFMLTLARKLHQIGGLISPEQLTAAGYSPTTFDRRHTAMSGWARITGLRLLYESTLGIIGLGEIGRELALRASALGMRVLYYQRTRLADAEEERWGARYAPLEQLLAESDWVSLQLPRGPETRGFMDRRRLAAMKPGAFLINTAQADQVDRQALLDALRSGHLGGFALDPLYEEPGRSDDDLLGFPNVFLTPHTAAQPRFNALKDFEEMLTGLDAALAQADAQGPARR